MEFRKSQRPLEPQLKPGEYIIYPEYDASLTQRGYEKEYRKLAERYSLLGMTERQYIYFRTVHRFQCGPGLPWVGIERIAQAMYRSYHTVYKIRQELVDAGFLIMRGVYHSGQDSVVYLHDFTPLYQMVQALDDEVLYQEAVAIEHALRQERISINSYAARMRHARARSTTPAEPPPSPEGRLELVLYREQFRTHLLEHAQACYTSAAFADASSPAQLQAEPLAEPLAISLAESQGNIDLIVRDNNNINNNTQERDLSNLSKCPSHEKFFSNEDEISTASAPLAQEEHVQLVSSGDSTSASEIQITQEITNSESYSDQTSPSQPDQADSDCQASRIVEEVLGERRPEAGEQAQASERRTQERVALKKQRPRLDEDLVPLVQDFSAQFHDQVPQSSIMRVAKIARVARRGGMTKTEFVRAMYKARKQTLRALVQKRTDDGKHTNRMPYFLECLEYLVYYHIESQQGTYGQAPPHVRANEL